MAHIILSDFRTYTALGMFIKIRIVAIIVSVNAWYLNFWNHENLLGYFNVRRRSIELTTLTHE